MRYAHGIDDGTKTNRTQKFSISLTSIPVDFAITQGRVKMPLLLVTRIAFLLDVPPRSQQVQVFLMWQRDIAWTKSNRWGRKSYKTEKLFPPNLHFAKQALEFFETWTCALLYRHVFRALKPLTFSLMICLMLLLKREQKLEKKERLVEEGCCDQIDTCQDLVNFFLTNISFSIFCYQDLVNFFPIKIISFLSKLVNLFLVEIFFFYRDMPWSISFSSEFFFYQNYRQLSHSFCKFTPPFGTKY